MTTKLHTPSAGGVIIKDTNVLLIFSAIRSSYAFPKGTIDNGEAVEHAAVREVKEETGYDVEIGDLLKESTFEFDAKDGTHYRKTVTYYSMEILNDNAPVPNLQPGEDFVNVWVSIDEARKLLTFDDLKEILDLAVKAEIK